MRSARIGILSLTMCAAALLGACADREPVPPSAADLKRLAAEDAKQYTSEEQCLTDFQWPVTTTTIADGTSTWYVNHDLLEALTAGGFAKRTVRYEKKVDKAGAVSQPSFVYELTAVAKPLVRVKSMPQFDGTKADKKILCFGRLSYDGNVEQGMVYVPDDNFMNSFGSRPLSRLTSCSPLFQPCFTSSHAYGKRMGSDFSIVQPLPASRTSTSIFLTRNTLSYIIRYASSLAVLPASFAIADGKSSLDGTVCRE